MKKLGILVGVVLVLFGGIYFATRPTNTNVVLKEITATELVTKVEAKENFTVYVYSDTCSHCKTFSPVLEAYLQNNNQEILKVATTKSEDQAIIAQAFGDKFQGTPSIFSLENGSIKDYVVGAQTQDQLKEYAGKNEAIFHV